MAVAHALCHVTCRWEPEKPKIWKPWPHFLPIHYATFRGLRWWL